MGPRSKAASSRTSTNSPESRSPLVADLAKSIRHQGSRPEARRGAAQQIRERGGRPPPPRSLIPAGLRKPILAAGSPRARSLVAFLYRESGPDDRANRSSPGKRHGYGPVPDGAPFRPAKVGRAMDGRRASRRFGMGRPPPPSRFEKIARGGDDRLPKAGRRESRHTPGDFHELDAPKPLGPRSSRDVHRRRQRTRPKARRSSPHADRGAISVDDAVCSA